MGNKKEAEEVLRLFFNGLKNNESVCHSDNTGKHMFKGVCGTLVIANGNCFKNDGQTADLTIARCINCSADRRKSVRQCEGTFGLWNLYAYVVEKAKSVHRSLKTAIALMDRLN